MKKQLGLTYIFLLLGIFPTFAQSEFTCAKQRMKDYIIDGQQYNLVLKGSDKGKVFFSFFDVFEYRIALCSSTHKSYKIAIYDIEKKLLYSGSCEDYTKVLDLSFKSNIAGYIEVTCENQGKIEPAFQIVIGFKELKDQTNTNKE